MAINMDDFDFSVDPSDDFAEFVNGNWKKNNKIPEKYTKWGTFEILHEDNLKKLKEIVESSTKDDIYKNIGILYNLAMDEERLEKEGLKPFQDIKKLILDASDKNELWKVMAILNKYGLAGMFSIYSQEDAKNSSLVVLNISTGGLGLPDKDYYFLEDKEDIRTKYKNYIKDILLLLHPLNYDDNLITQDVSKIDKIIEKIFDIEISLASHTFTKVEKRDPEKNYNKVDLAQINHLSKLDWNSYFKESNILPFKGENDIPYMIVDNLDFFKNLGELWASTDINLLKLYLLFKSLSNSAYYLNNKLVDLKFNFYGKFLSGQKQNKPRLERAISMIEMTIGELLGRKYCEQYFSSVSKDRMLDMINSLNNELEKRLKNLTWMSEETKEKALLKQKVFKAKIGYPDKWRDFSSLCLGSNHTDTESLLKVIIDCNLFNHEYDISQLFKPTDPHKWEMDPHDVNAYFHPIRNEIVFPAGILQPPFFYPDGDDALNYGAIGTVIGHEMTHSYDDMGSKFDHNGQLNNWWSDIDIEQFKKKSDYYVEEYSNCLINGKNVNGELTLGENLADHGGVKIAFYALKKKLEDKKIKEIEEIDEIDEINVPKMKSLVKYEKFNIYQRFFISWAIVWRCNITSEEEDKRLLTDPHSPNVLRINCTLKNIPEFHETFKIKSGNMYRKNPVQMW
jgi:putative endopeptidase